MKKENAFLLFIRKNVIYIILSLCIAAVAFSVVLMIARQNESAKIVSVDKQEEQPVEEEQPTDTIITFAMPVSYTTGITEYCDTPVFNSTLGRYSAHLAMDFFAPEGTKVYAVYDGVVEKVESTLLQGVTVTLDHGNGLKTVYNSLADGDEVFVGLKVKKGDVIGEVSSTNRQEYKDGAHLHFQVIEDGKEINPSKYLDVSEK